MLRAHAHVLDARCDQADTWLVEPWTSSGSHAGASQRHPLHAATRAPCPLIEVAEIQFTLQNKASPQR